MKHKKHIRGFTLFEIVIYLAFFALFISSMSSLFYFYITESNKISNHIFQDQEMNFVQHKMTYEIEHVDRIIYPTNSTSSTLTYVSNMDHIQKTFLIASGTPSVHYLSGEIYSLTDTKNASSSLLFTVISTSTISVSLMYQNQASTFLLLPNL